MKTKAKESWLHLEFMGTNKLTPDSFSEALQKKISIFGMLLQGLDETIDEDTRTLQKKLDALDKEIYGDMLEEYEEFLENNEMSEPLMKPETGKPTDQELLENLWQMGRKKSLRRSTLRDMGFKGDLSKGAVRVGNFWLQRTGVFIHSYDIVKA